MSEIMNVQDSDLRDSNYGWVICGMSALLLFCTVGLCSTGFSIYSPYLIRIGGLTNTQASSVVLFRNLFSVVTMLFTGRLIDRWEVKRVITAALILCGASFFLYSSATGFPVYCLASSVSGVSIGLGGMIPASILISRWFNEHRGLALGICMAATGLSSIVAAPVITLLIQAHSLSFAFICEGVFILVCALIVHKFTYSLPGCVHTRPIGAHHTNVSKLYAAHETSAKLYFLMMLGIFLFGVSANTLTSHVSVLYNAAGYDAATVALLLAIYGLFLAIGKCSYGAIADKIGTTRASILLYIMTLVGCGLACLAESKILILAYLSVVTMSFGLAVTTVSTSMYASGISTEKEYSHTVARFNVLSTAGGLVFGAVPGMIADRTGSYVPAFVILFVITIVAIIILISTYSRIREEDLEYARENHG